jgi:RNA polymerase sigma-70 factor (ECF subfamily)
MPRALALDELNQFAFPKSRVGLPRLRDFRNKWVRQSLIPLVLRAQARDRPAFAELWERHSRLIHAILLSMVPDQEAEDLMQEVALAAWRSLDNLEEPERFTPWLTTIARNLGRDMLKRPHCTEQIRPAHERLAVEPARADQKLEADDVMNCIRSLPEPYREPLTLRLVLELSAKEIADRTGLTRGSVRVNLCRGMKLLRAAFDDGTT